MGESQALVVVDQPSPPTIVGERILPMTEAAIDKAREFEAMVLAQPQVKILTEHLIHGGVYLRTVFIPAGVAISGALIKVPTVLIVQGDATIYIGDEPMELSGYRVVPASAGRKQAFYARSDVYLTMILASDALDVEAAEHQFTDEFDLLASHRDVETNRIIITGE